MGNLTRTDAVADGTTIQTLISYDHRGVKTGMTDADKGTYAYVTNAFGELTQQTDARGNVTSIGYDQYGRKTYQQVVHGSENDDNINELTLYRYMDPNTSHGSAFNSGVERLGQLIEVAHASGASSYSTGVSFDTFAANDAQYHEQYQLDGYGRAVGTVRMVDANLAVAGDEEMFHTFTNYDQYGRVFQQFDAANEDSAVQYEYNQYGFVTKLWDARRVNGELTNYFQETLAVDPRGKVVLEARGDNNMVRRYFDVNGQIMLKITSPGGIVIDLASDNANYLEYVQYRWD
ncbi:hypothetical protein, partial [uncultured Umboniibacter sp.]|uniref:hypothetical protein n=1 Tax=uncultured Umboniibacter sp. TaxID=1798917 RepID=UPI002630AFC8